MPTQEDKKEVFYTVYINYGEIRFGPFPTRKDAEDAASLYLESFPNDTVVSIKETIDSNATKQPD